jgi:hypothetical protein
MIIQGSYPLQDCYPQLERTLQVMEEQGLGYSLSITQLNMLKTKVKQKQL